MFKARALLTGCLVAFILPATIANISPVPPSKIHVDVTLHPNESKDFKNPLPWKAKVKCTLHSNGQPIAIEVDEHSHNISINGNTVHANEQIVINTSDNTRYEIKADKKASGKLINTGENTFDARCEV